MNENIQPGPDTIQNLLKSKKIIVVLVVVLLIAAVVPFVLMNSVKPNAEPVSKVKPTKEVTVPTQIPEMQKAINETKKAAQEYDSGKDAVRGKYPWIQKLPLASSKYYVYFDIQQNKFIGKLYPTSTDNLEAMRTSILNELKNGKGIPYEGYQFDWIVIQQ